MGWCLFYAKKGCLSKYWKINKDVKFFSWQAVNSDSYAAFEGFFLIILLFFIYKSMKLLLYAANK